MANEISISASLSVNKGGASLSRAIAKSFDMGGDDLGQGTQLIGTSDEQLVLPADISTAKVLVLENLDATNYVELSYGTGGSFVAEIRLDANGGFAVFRPTSMTIYLKANTAACRVKWDVVEA